MVESSGRSDERGGGLRVEQTDFLEDGREMGPLLVGDRHQRPTDIRRLEDTEDAETFLQSDAVVADRRGEDDVGEPLDAAPERPRFVDPTRVPGGDDVNRHRPASRTSSAMR